MRWDDERYVRFYTRDQPEWLALSWQARGLFGLIMRKVDRAGIMKVGRLGLRGVAVTVTAPWTEIERPLRELIDDGCVRFDEAAGVVLVPNFLAAQEARQSDRVRKEKQRELARVTAELHLEGVTHRDTASPNVTESHIQSREVTPCCAVPSRTVLGGEMHSQASAPATPGLTESKPRRQPKGSRLSEDWQPSPELVDRLRRELRVDASAAVRDFVAYWVNASRNAIKPRWDLAFETWVRKDARDNRLPAWEPQRPGRTVPRPILEQQARLASNGGVVSPTTAPELKAAMSDLFANAAKPLEGT